MDIGQSKGILYIAYGEKAIANVENAITILRKFNKSIQVAVISDKKVKGCNQWIEHEDTDPGARSIKTRMYQLSPFDQTLFMDADTELQCDPAPVFKLLSFVDMAMAQDPVRMFKDNSWQAIDKGERATTIKETNGAGFLYYNTGVILFNKNERVERLMKAWHEEWKRWKRQDQPAMFRAMQKNPVRLATLRRPFNTHHKNLAKFVYHAHRRASRDGAPK